MSATLKRWLQIMVRLGLLAVACPVHAFYNPSTGRWLSRDPMEERVEHNLFTFVKNSSIANFDLFGLKTTFSTFFVPPAKTRYFEPKDGDVVGETRGIWAVIPKVVSSGSCYSVDISGAGGIETYWYNPLAQGAEEHEATHVRLIQANYLELGKALNFPSCMCRPKAVCYANFLVPKYDEYYRARRDEVNTFFDCQSYGACLNYYIARQAAAQALEALNKQKSICDGGT